MKKKLVTILGIGLTICGFYMSRARSFPTIERLVAPRYVASKEAIRILEEKGTLSTGDPGFSALEPLVLEQAAKNNPRVVLLSASVTRMELRFRGESRGRIVTENAPTKVFLSNELESQYIDLVPIEKELEESANNRFLVWSQRILWVGVVIALVGIFL